MNREGVNVPTLLIQPSGWVEIPLVVLCRGDAAPEVDGQDRQIAGFLESAGIASALLDFSERAGSLEPTRAALANPVTDLSLLLDALRVRSGINPAKIGYYGSGLAGAMGLLLAAGDVRVRTLVLASSPVPPPTANLSVDVPTLFIAGAEDAATRNEVPRLESWLRGPYELRIIPRADAHFTSASAFGRVARDTVSWFTRYLGTGYQAMRA
jgi:predicted dienelactone hydrolase